MSWGHAVAGGSGDLKTQLLLKTMLGSMTLPPLGGLT